VEALRRLALLLSVGSWLVVLRGLWFASIAADPALDLEAGGGFAANVEVYLPAITLAFVVVVMAAASRRGWGVATLVVSTTTATFSSWALTRGYLLDYRPSLDAHLGAGLGIAIIAAIVVVLTLSEGPPRGTEKADREGSEPRPGADVRAAPPGSA
jgi:hypothetical protein